jgi:hypothetical protein
METAVEWIEGYLKKFNHIQESLSLKKAFEQAKEMEINQHNETWDVAHQAGRFEGKGIAKKDWQTFETHWEETFKSE